MQFTNLSIIFINRYSYCSDTGKPRLFWYSISVTTIKRCVSRWTNTRPWWNCHITVSKIPLTIKSMYHKVSLSKYYYRVCGLIYLMTLSQLGRPYLAIFLHHMFDMVFSMLKFGLFLTSKSFSFSLKNQKENTNIHWHNKGQGVCLNHETQSLI